MRSPRSKSADPPPTSIQKRWCNLKATNWFSNTADWSAVFENQFVAFKLHQRFWIDVGGGSADFDLGDRIFLSFDQIAGKQSRRRRSGILVHQHADTVAVQHGGGIVSQQRRRQNCDYGQAKEMAPLEQNYFSQAFERLLGSLACGFGARYWLLWCQRA